MSGRHDLFMVGRPSAYDTRRESRTPRLVVLIVYLLAMAAVGIIVGLKVKDTDHYFLGKRKFSKWLMIGQSFGQGDPRRDARVAGGGGLHRRGLGDLVPVGRISSPRALYWVMAPVFRRARPRRHEAFHRAGTTGHPAPHPQPRSGADRRAFR